jgi:hypothetical protein
MKMDKMDKLYVIAAAVVITSIILAGVAVALDSLQFKANIGADVEAPILTPSPSPSPTPTPTPTPTPVVPVKSAVFATGAVESPESVHYNPGDEISLDFGKVQYIEPTTTTRSPHYAIFFRLINTGEVGFNYTVTITGDSAFSPFASPAIGTIPFGGEEVIYFMLVPLPDTPVGHYSWTATIDVQ